MQTRGTADRNDSYNAVAELSYRVGIGVVVALICIILIASLRAGTLRRLGLRIFGARVRVENQGEEGRNVQAVSVTTPASPSPMRAGVETQADVP